MGAENLEVRYINERVVEISFEWGYSVEEARTRKITFIQADISQPQDYPPQLAYLLNKGIDVFFEKASTGGFSGIPAVGKIITDNLSEHDLVVSDEDYTQKLSLQDIDLIRLAKTDLINTLEQKFRDITYDYGLILGIWQKELAYEFANRNTSIHFTPRFDELDELGAWHPGSHYSDGEMAQYENRRRKIRNLLDEALEFIQQSQYRDAIAKLKELVGMGIADPGIYNNLGVAYIGLGEIKYYRAAICCFKKELELNPDFLDGCGFR